MKALFYFYSAFNGTMLGILLDEAKKLIIEKNADVYFIMCEGFLDVCLANPSGNKSVCAVCKKHSIRTIKSTLGNKCTILHLRDYHDKIKVRNFEYESTEDLKKIEYKGVMIGYATLSTYIYLTRNQNPKINEESKKYFDTLLNQSARLTNAFQTILDDLAPDIICSYNGRFNEFRPLYETALKNKIDINLYEVVRMRDERLFKVVFQNMLPHNVKKNLWRVEECWKNPELEEGENVRIGKGFFQRRRSGLVAGDQVYTAQMKQGLLPKKWDSNKRNIVIFNSSEDEFVAIGEEYSELSLFTSQVDGLKSIFDQFKNEEDLHFYLRIHPNLAGITYRYHKELYNFETIYSNVTVISPQSDINSYDLMEACEKVVVFGSTMGLEAAYWGKPVILLSCAFYYYADLCYIPKTVEELFDLINSDLSSKYNDNALKYGLYYLDKSPVLIDKEQQFKYVDYNPISVNVLGRKVNSYNYMKTLGSRKLSAVITRGKKLVADKLFPSSYQLPFEEE